MQETIEIFGRDGGQPKKHRKGIFVTVNMKNRNAYLSRDARDQIFGKDTKKEGRLLIIHSKIEKRWYFAKAGGDLFNGGFECIQNDMKADDSVWRINGAFPALKAMIAEMVPGNQKERIVFTFDSVPSKYENMNLYRAILTNK